MVFMLLLHCRVYVLRVGGCGSISFLFSLSLLVRPLFSPETLFMCVLLCLELTVTHAAFSASLGMPLVGRFLSGDRSTSRLSPSPRIH